MEEDILKDIVEDLNFSIKEKGKFIKLYYEDYEPVEIDKSNFHEIKDIASENKLAFIDGGNCEILKAPNFSLQFIRVYYTIYKNNKRIENKRYEFYLLIRSLSKDNKILYKTKAFGGNLIGEIEFDSFDKTISQGNNRADISFVGNVARRFSELSIAKEVLDKLEKNDAIVFDGSLEAKYTHEEKILDELFEKAAKKDIMLAGLSKTCELLTDKGNSVIGVLAEMQIDGEWFYNPVAKLNKRFDIYFAKLNKDSDYVFRIDSTKKDDKVFSMLKSNSTDPVFFGYPYALIESDKFARVTNKESEIFKTKFMMKAGKDWKKISSFLKSNDAHSVLDSIS